MALSLSPEHRRGLVDLARSSIREGLEGRGPLAPELDGAPPALREPRGAFVTVNVDGELNGCIGAFEPVEPLLVVVPRVAWGAAFDDPRLPPLTGADYERATVKISALSDLEPLPAATEDEVAAALRPGVDGLLLRTRWRRGTLLPAMWDQLPDARDFVRTVLIKAGLSPFAWPLGVQAFRYIAEEFGDDG